MNKDRLSGLSIYSLVIGIVSLLCVMVTLFLFLFNELSVIFIFAVIGSISGVICGIKQLKTKGIAKAGFICNLVALGLSLMLTVVFVIDGYISYQEYQHVVQVEREGLNNSKQ